MNVVKALNEVMNDFWSHITKKKVKVEMGDDSGSVYLTMLVEIQRGRADGYKKLLSST